MPRNTGQKDSSEINRRKILKSIGGAGAMALSSTSIFAALASAEPDPKQPSQENLEATVREVAGEKDVVNLMGKAWSRRVRSSKLTKSQKNKETKRDPSSNFTRSKGTKYELDLDESVAVAIVDHTLDGGNTMIAVGFLINDEQILVHYEFEEAANGVKSNANLWNIVDKGEAGELSLEDASYNGERIKSVAEISENEITTQSDDPCGGCDCRGRGDPDGGYELDEICDGSIDLVCALNVIGCATCVGCSGTGWCAACVLTACPTVAASCCEGTSETCMSCNCSGGSR